MKLQYSRLILGLGAVLVLTSTAIPSASSADAQTTRAAAVQTLRPDTDTDRDGTPDVQDACLRTPTGAAPLTRGCAPVDLVHNGQALTEPVLHATRDARQAVDRDTGLVEVQRALATAEARLRDTVLAPLNEGRICDGAAAFTRSMDSLSAAHISVSRLVPELRARVASEHRHDAGHEYADADASDARWADLGYKSRLVDAALGAAQQARFAFDAACAAVAGTVTIEGAIANIDDAAGLLVMGDARVFALPTQRSSSLAEGVQIQATAATFKDGSGAILDLGPDVPASIPRGSWAPCMTLRIAPFQNGLHPLSNASTVLHDLRGYGNSGTHYLEDRMGLAAQDEGCVKTQGLGFYRYSLRIEMTSHTTAGSDPQSFVTLAPDLTPKDKPVMFSSVSENDDLLRKLTVRVRRQFCHVTYPSGSTCSTPQPLSEQQLWVTLKSTGAYCSATYDKTVFSIEDHVPTEFEKATVTYKTVHPSVPATWIFEAEGWPGATGKSGGVATLNTGDPFAVYSDAADMYALPLPAGELVDQYAWYGVRRPAGLSWPRIIGQRNGYPYRYSCETPALVKDAVDVAANSFHRLPWAGGIAYKVTQGNNGSFTHNGGQAFAFDFGIPSGNSIRATRGGRVRFAEETLTKNCNPNNGDPWCPGNTLVIEHQDGTHSFHMQVNSIKVEEGDYVRRGDNIARVGNTGNSTGPHLHFQVQSDDTSTGGGGPTLQTCFEVKAAYLLNDPPTPMGASIPCLIPEKG